MALGIKQFGAAIVALGAAGTATYFGAPDGETDESAFSLAERDDGFEICLETDIPLFEGDQKGCLDRRDLAELRRAALLNRDGDPITLSLAHPTDATADAFECSTCGQYDDLIFEGWYAETSRDMRREAYFVRACALLSLLSRAEKAEESFFGEDGLTETVMENLSTDRLPRLAENADVAATDMSLIRDNDGNWRYEDDDRFVTVEELALADFDGDGVQDILVLVVAGPNDGTAKIVDYGILKRATASDSVEYVSQLDKPGA